MKSSIFSRLLLGLILMFLAGSARAAEGLSPQRDPACVPDGNYPPNSAYNRCEFPELFEGTVPQRETPSAEVLDQPDLNVAYIQQQPRYDYTAAKKQHAPGDPVSFVATIANRGAQPTSEFSYQWEMDGVVVVQGTYPDLEPDEMAQLTFVWVWESGPHTISLALDPANAISEVSELNNQVTDRTNALAVGFWVERSVYEWFNENQVYLGLGSVSWDDWAQRQLAHWNQMFAEAVSPLSPEGIGERVRLDKVTILEDGAYPSCANTFWPEDKTVDLVWGFISESVGVPSGHTCSLLNFYQIYPQFQVLELPLLHEMSHARYIIDLYGLNLGVGAEFLSTSVDSTATTLPVMRDVTNATNFPLPASLAVGGELIVCQTRAGMAFSNCTRGADGTTPRPHAVGTLINLANVRIQDGAGNLVQGSSDLPVVGYWQDHLYYNRYEGIDLMGSGVGYGQHSAYAWNRIAGRRPICGNYNAPCNIGEYLNEIPAANLLEIRDLNGNPVEGAQVEMYYARPVAVWYGKYFPKNPDKLLTTDASGQANMGAFPFGTTPGMIHTWGFSNTLVLLKLSYGNVEMYRFFEVTEANEAYWSGHQDEAIYPISIGVLPSFTYLSTNTGGSIGGVDFADEDILAYDMAGGGWSLYFDGSEVGLQSVNVEGLSVTAEGILMSFDQSLRLPGVGRVDDADIVRFIPTSLGENTSGSFEFFFDGSDVGLTTESEGIDAFTFTPDGRLLVSTKGAFSVPRTSRSSLTGGDEDLIALNGTPGINSQGTWEMYFDGSDVMTEAQDVWGAWLDPATNGLLLSLQNGITLGGASGDANDIFLCYPFSPGETTNCAFSSELYFNGSEAGLEDFRIDGFSLENPLYEDAHTLLRLHFEGNYYGTLGEVGTPDGTEFTEGYIGQGLHIDGSDSLTYPTEGNLNRTEGTIEFWIKPDWNGNDFLDHTFFEAGNASFERVHIAKDGANNLRFIFWDTITEYGIAYNLSNWVAGEWHHLGFTWQGTQMNLYIDGVLLATANNLQPPDLQGTVIHVGSTFWENKQANAVIDELHISNIPQITYDPADKPDD